MHDESSLCAAEEYGNSFEIVVRSVRIGDTEARDENDYKDHIAVVASHDRRADNLVRAFLDVNFCETVVFAFENREIHVAEVLHIDIDFDSLFLGFMFVQSYMRYLWGRVRTPRNLERTRLLAAFEQCVLDNDTSHEIGSVRELIRRTDVAGGVDAWVGRLQAIVDLDAFFVEVDADAFEIEVLDIRRASHGDQQLVDRFVVALVVGLDGQADFALALDLRLASTTEQFHAVAHQNLLHNLGGLTIFARQDAVLGLDKKDLGAELCKRLCQLAADRVGSDNAQSSRQFGQREHAFVGQYFTPSSPVIGGAAARAPVATTARLKLSFVPSMSIVLESIKRPCPK